MDGLKNELSFISSKLFVFSHGIEADNKMFVLALDWRKFNWIPGLFLRFKICSCGLCISFTLLLVRFMLSLFLLLSSHSIVVSVEILKSLLETTNTQAGLVHKWNGHVRAQSWHIPEVHLALAHDLFDVDVLELVTNVTVVWLFDFIAFFVLWVHIDCCVLGGEVLGEHIMCDALSWFETRANNLGAVVDVGENELDHFR